MMNTGYRELLQERDRMLEQYADAPGEERIRIIARLVVLDEEIDGCEEGV